MRFWFISFLLFLFPFLVFAQIDNRSFYFQNERLSFSDSAKKNQRKLYIEANYFGFIRNREYFETIADGYTLFGSQFLTKLSYSSDSTLKISAGVFLRKDFGNEGFKQIQPYFQFLYRKNKHKFIFGNLEGNLQHGLIEPLFNFENIINRRLENGVQYKFLSKKTSLDTWIDWVTMIYPYSDFDEELHFGLSAEHQVYDSEKWRATFPLQFTAIHRGGQINTTDTPLVTIFNAAIGNTITYYLDRSKEKKPRLKHIKTQLYGTFFLDNSSVPSFEFENGTGIYANVEFATRKHQFMISYWRGQEFVAPLGGDIYSSVSRIFDPNTENQPLRNLIICRVLTNFSIPNIAKDEANIIFRLAPFYNLETQELNFSAGLYATFSTMFLLRNFRN